MLLVGSKALQKNLGFALEYQDIDVIGTKDNALELIKKLQPNKVNETDYVISLIGINKCVDYNRDNVEILLSDNSVSLRMYLKYTTGSEDSSMDLVVAPLEVLYSIKKSHINFPINFKKHIESFVLLSKYQRGIDLLSEITKINFEETEKRLGKLKTPKLNKTTNTFFGQSEKYVKSYFIHDQIHNMIAHFGKPGYTYMQPDSKSVMCSKVMWDEFTSEMKMKTVLEECYVIALERKILPMLFGGGKLATPREAFLWAFQRVCTTLCSGWFREYATIHYFEIDMLYNENYAQDFLQKYQDGQINRCDN